MIQPKIVRNYFDEHFLMTVKFTKTNFSVAPIIPLDIVLYDSM